MVIFYFPHSFYLLVGIQYFCCYFPCYSNCSRFSHWKLLRFDSSLLLTWPFGFLLCSVVDLLKNIKAYCDFLVLEGLVVFNTVLISVITEWSRIILNFLGPALESAISSKSQPLEVTKNSFLGKHTFLKSTFTWIKHLDLDSWKWTDIQYNSEVFIHYNCIHDM